MLYIFDKQVSKASRIMASANHTKKWLTLGLVGVGLLLIPRRSSVKADQPLSQNFKPIRDTKNKGFDK